MNSRPLSAFARTVLRVADAIPPGRVMTYGDVAAAAGTRAAQAVGVVMARHGYAVAWWRVVPATGELISGHAAESLGLYHEEGTPLLRRDNRWVIDLRSALWTPPRALAECLREGTPEPDTIGHAPAEEASADGA